jgi:redox-sensitive bicupin YhaK (pirin superfamily)
MIPAKMSIEGEGFLVHRAFPSQTLLDFDPFLLFDEMGPIDHQPGNAKGAPDHPHRGFETVTYMLSGCFEHNDSFGHNGKLEPGDVQWMTAGSGLIHSEMPEKSFLEKGGTLHGIQLWINLPKEHKMISPHYQEIKSVDIPIGVSEDNKVQVRVLAGEAFNAKAIIQTRTPIFYLHAVIQPGGRWEQPILKEFNVFAYVLKGEGLFSRKSETNLKSCELHQMIMFDNDGDSIELIVPSDFNDPFEVLLIGGVPINEPIVRYGPFVMNTEEEIRTAFIDYHTGKMGTIKR